MQGMRGPGQLGPLIALARTQHGLFTRQQARTSGFTINQVAHRVALGIWEAVDYGVYRPAGTPSSWKQRLLAACLAGPAVASHRAAAALWSFPGFDDAPVEVTAVRHLRRHAADVVWHESRRLAELDVTEIDRIPVTRAARTIVDLGAVVDDGKLIAALDDAMRKSLTTQAAVEQLLEKLGARRLGSGRVRRTLARRPAGSGVPESILESAFDQLVHSYGLPVPTRQYEIRDGDGALVARVDFAYVAVRLAIEIDSVRYHAGTADWQRDLDRQDQLLALNWRVLRFTAAHLTARRDWVAGLVTAALNTKGRI